MITHNDSVKLTEVICVIKNRLSKGRKDNMKYKNTNLLEYWKLFS